MMSPVLCETTFFLHRGDVDPLPVQVRLAWDPYDPVAVKVEFQTALTPTGDHALWYFARSLLATGLLTPTGCGDVQVFPAVDGWLRVSLDSPSGHAEFTTEVEPVEGFLRDSYVRCPVGDEYNWLDIDAALADLLEGECAS